MNKTQNKNLKKQHKPETKTGYIQWHDQLESWDRGCDVSQSGIKGRWESQTAYVSAEWENSMWRFDLLNWYWGIITYGPGLHRERANGDAPTIRDRWRPNLTLSPLE